MRRHINEFFRLDCSGDLLNLRVFPNAKEITESMGAFHAVRKVIIPETGLRYDDPNTVVFVVGDGAKPRTGAMFAMRSRWNVVSIDPTMNFGRGVMRLTVVRRKIENENFYSPSKIALIILVHSHAKIQDCLDAIRYPTRHVVSIPCCVPHDLPHKTFVGYKDTDIWSEKNDVKVWLNA